MALRPTHVYIDEDIKLLYIFHFSLFLYYTISFVIIYYLIIIKVIVWLRSKLLSLADYIFHLDIKMFIYRHVITNKFALWWSDKLKHEWKHYCIYYKCGLLFIEKKTNFVYIIFLSYIPMEIKERYLMQTIIAQQTKFYWKDFPIQYYLGTHNIQTSVTPQRIWFLQADDNSSTNTLDVNQYTINSGEP